MSEFKAEDRILLPAPFSFYEPGDRCAYWSDGRHVVQNMKCRCGREFYVVERVVKEIAGCR